MQTLPSSHGPDAPLEEVVLIITVLFCLIGIVVTDFSPQDAFMYWMAMNLVFGFLAIVVGWHRAKIERRKGGPKDCGDGDLIRVQSLHWLGAMVAVFCVFGFAQSERMGDDVASLMVLLILALATFLDGIRIGWRFSLTGIYLAATTVVANYVDNFVPWLFVLAILIIAATVYYEKRRYAHRR